MKRNAASFVRCAAGLLGLMAAGWLLAGRAAEPSEGIPTDWTHRHVIFSQPATTERVESVGRDPRYWQQWYRHNVARAVAADVENSFATSYIRHGRGSGQLLHSDWSVNLGSGASVGAGNFPAKFSFGINTAFCSSAPSPDYVVFATGLLGSATQASIVAFDNLYSGCTGTVPLVYWAYNTGGQILTSPVISGGGGEVAFVQTSGGAASFVVLKFAPSTGTIGAPVTLTPVAPAGFLACAAPCMTQVPLKDGFGSPTDDTTSSPFIDYTHDTAWVGGSPGWLHKITQVFRGVPAEVNAGGFPVNVRSTSSISSPIHDQVSGSVFVGDSGGVLNRVNPTTGAVTSSGQLDFAPTGLIAGPIVDSTAGRVWVFAANDNSVACGGSPCAAVYNFTVGFTGGTTGTKVTVGTSSGTPKPLFAGGFDSAYQNSGNATGNLYVCGNTGGAPTMYRVAINSGTFGSVVAGPALSGGATSCSPVTDIPNPNAPVNPTEWVFASAAGTGSGSNCAGGGCIVNLKVQPWKANTAYIAGQQVLDTHFQVQTCRVGGTSRPATPPTWSTTLGATTADNTVRWINEGPLAPSYATWIASHAYALNQEIVDSNGNIEIVLTAGTSKTGNHPNWSAAVNGVTNEGTGLRWRNLGAIGTASKASAGGTSGIIIDNVVGSGTLPGASQVYYSTQGNQNCGTSGTGGCAVQASQSALQ